MAIKRIKNKKLLEQLQAKLVLRMGVKLTEQEILNFCLVLADQNIDKLIELVDNVPKVNPSKFEYYMKKRDQLVDVPYNVSWTFENLDDEDIYNI